MNYNLLKLNLYSLAKGLQELKKAGGPEFNGLLFEEIMALEEDILNRFGLPFRPPYTQIFEFNELPNETEIGYKIKQLEMEAEKYLNSSVSTTKQLLQIAIDNQLPANEILPELKIPMHTYTVFVYENILLKSRDTLDTIWSELNKANQSEILDAIGRLVQNDPQLSKLAHNYLEDQNLKYLQAFVIDRFDLMSQDEYWSLVGMGVEVKWGS